jgi:hypothetical protein
MHEFGNIAHGHAQRDLCPGGLLLCGSKCMLVLPLLRPVLCTIDKALRRFQPADDVKVPRVSQYCAELRVACKSHRRCRYVGTAPCTPTSECQLAETPVPAPAPTSVLELCMSTCDSSASAT